MWILEKPDTIKAFGSDVDELVAHCVSLDAADAVDLKKLHHQYDKNGGTASPAELAKLDPKKDIIKNQYTSKVKKGGTLEVIRKDLFQNVEQCPMCGINQPSQLDHYMDKKTYGQLACCRLNLVPACGICNHTKSNGDYTKYVHAYYDRYDPADFLVTIVTVKNNRLGFRFFIDKGAIQDINLATRTESQFNELHLNSRFHKAAINFVEELVKGLTCKKDRSLMQKLKSWEAYYQDRYGRNHWKTSVIRGLRACPAFNIAVVNAMRTKPVTKMINGISA